MKIYLSEYDIGPDGESRRHTEYKLAASLVRALENHGFPVNGRSEQN